MEDTQQTNIPIRNDAIQADNSTVSMNIDTVPMVTVVSLSSSSSVILSSSSSSSSELAVNSTKTETEQQLSFPSSSYQPSVQQPTHYRSMGKLPYELFTQRVQNMLTEINTTSIHNHQQSFPSFFPSSTSKKPANFYGLSRRQQQLLRKYKNPSSSSPENIQPSETNQVPFFPTLVHSSSSSSTNVSSSTTVVPSHQINRQRKHPRLFTTVEDTLQSFLRQKQHQNSSHLSTNMIENTENDDTDIHHTLDDNKSLSSSDDLFTSTTTILRPNKKAFASIPNTEEIYIETIPIGLRDREREAHVHFREVPEEWAGLFAAITDGDLHRVMTLWSPTVLKQTLRLSPSAVWHPLLVAVHRFWIDIVAFLIAAGCDAQLHGTVHPYPGDLLRPEEAQHDNTSPAKLRSVMQDLQVSDSNGNGRKLEYVSLRAMSLFTQKDRKEGRRAALKHLKWLAKRYRREEIPGKQPWPPVNVRINKEYVHSASLLLASRKTVCQITKPAIGYRGGPLPDYDAEGYAYWNEQLNGYLCKGSADPFRQDITTITSTASNNRNTLSSSSSKDYESLSESDNNENRNDNVVVPEPRTKPLATGDNDQGTPNRVPNLTEGSHAVVDEGIPTSHASSSTVIIPSSFNAVPVAHTFQDINTVWREGGGEFYHPDEVPPHFQPLIYRCIFSNTSSMRNKPAEQDNIAPLIKCLQAFLQGHPIRSDSIEDDDASSGSSSSSSSATSTGNGNDLTNLPSILGTNENIGTALTSFPLDTTVGKQQLHVLFSAPPDSQCHLLLHAVHHQRPAIVSLLLQLGFSALYPGTVHPYPGDELRPEETRKVTPLRLGRKMRDIAVSTSKRKRDIANQIVKMLEEYAIKETTSKQNTTELNGLVTTVVPGSLEVNHAPENTLVSDSNEISVQTEENTAMVTDKENDVSDITLAPVPTNIRRNRRKPILPQSLPVIANTAVIKYGLTVIGPTLTGTNENQNSGSKRKRSSKRVSTVQESKEEETYNSSPSEHGNLSDENNNNAENYHDGIGARKHERRAKRIALGNIALSVAPDVHFQMDNEEENEENAAKKLLRREKNRTTDDNDSSVSESDIIYVDSDNEEIEYEDDNVPMVRRATVNPYEREATEKLRYKRGLARREKRAANIYQEDDDNSKDHDTNGGVSNSRHRGRHNRKEKRSSRGTHISISTDDENDNDNSEGGDRQRAKHLRAYNQERDRRDSELINRLERMAKTSAARQRDLHPEHAIDTDDNDDEEDEETKHWGALVDDFTDDDKDSTSSSDMDADRLNNDDENFVNGNPPLVTDPSQRVMDSYLPSSTQNVKSKPLHRSIRNNRKSSYRGPIASLAFTRNRTSSYGSRAKNPRNANHSVSKRSILKSLLPQDTRKRLLEDLSIRIRNRLSGVSDHVFPIQYGNHIPRAHNSVDSTNEPWPIDPTIISDNVSSGPIRSVPNANTHNYRSINENHGTSLLSTVKENSLPHPLSSSSSSSSTSLTFANLRAQLNQRSMFEDDAMYPNLYDTILSHNRNDAGNASLNSGILCTLSRYQDIIPGGTYLSFGPSSNLATTSTARFSSVVPASSSSTATTLSSSAVSSSADLLSTSSVSSFLRLTDLQRELGQRNRLYNQIKGLLKLSSLLESGVRSSLQTMINTLANQITLVQRQQNASASSISTGALRSSAATQSINNGQLSALRLMMQNPLSTGQRLALLLNNGNTSNNSHNNNNNTDTTLGTESRNIPTWNESLIDLGTDNEDSTDAEDNGLVVATPPIMANHPHRTSISTTIANPNTGMLSSRSNNDPCNMDSDSKPQLPREVTIDGSTTSRIMEFNDDTVENRSENYRPLSPAFDDNTGNSDDQSNNTNTEPVDEEEQPMVADAMQIDVPENPLTSTVEDNYGSTDDSYRSTYTQLASALENEMTLQNAVSEEIAQVLQALDQQTQGAFSERQRVVFPVTPDMLAFFPRPTPVWYNEGFQFSFLLPSSFDAMVTEEKFTNLSNTQLQILPPWYDYCQNDESTIAESDKSMDISSNNGAMNVVEEPLEDDNHHPTSQSDIDHPSVPNMGISPAELDLQRVLCSIDFASDKVAAIRTVFRYLFPLYLNEIERAEVRAHFALLEQRKKSRSSSDNEDTNNAIFTEEYNAARIALGLLTKSFSSLDSMVQRMVALLKQGDQTKASTTVDLLDDIDINEINQTRLTLSTLLFSLFRLLARVTVEPPKQNSTVTMATDTDNVTNIQFHPSQETIGTSVSDTEETFPVGEEILSGRYRIQPRTILFILGLDNSIVPSDRSSNNCLPISRNNHSWNAEAYSILWVYALRWCKTVAEVYPDSLEECRALRKTIIKQLIQITVDYPTTLRLPGKDLEALATLASPSPTVVNLWSPILYVWNEFFVTFPTPLDGWCTLCRTLLSQRNSTKLPSYTFAFLESVPVNTTEDSESIILSSLLSNLANSEANMETYWYLLHNLLGIVSNFQRHHYISTVRARSTVRNSWYTQLTEKSFAAQVPLSHGYILGTPHESLQSSSSSCISSERCILDILTDVPSCGGGEAVSLPQTYFQNITVNHPQIVTLAILRARKLDTATMHTNVQDTNEILTEITEKNQSRIARILRRMHEGYTVVLRPSCVTYDDEPDSLDDGTENSSVSSNSLVVRLYSYAFNYSLDYTAIQVCLLDLLRSHSHRVHQYMQNINILTAKQKTNSSEDSLLTTRVAAFYVSIMERAIALGSPVRNSFTGTLSFPPSIPTNPATGVNTNPFPVSSQLFGIGNDGRIHITTEQKMLPTTVRTLLPSAATVPSFTTWGYNGNFHHESRHKETNRTFTLPRILPQEQSLFNQVLDPDHRTAYSSTVPQGYSWNLPSWLLLAATMGKVTVNDIEQARSSIQEYYSNVSCLSCIYPSQDISSYDHKTLTMEILQHCICAFIHTITGVLLTDTSFVTDTVTAPENTKTVTINSNAASTAVNNYIKKKKITGVSRIIRLSQTPHYSSSALVPPSSVNSNHGSSLSSTSSPPASLLDSILKVSPVYIPTDVRTMKQGTLNALVRSHASLHGRLCMLLLRFITSKITSTGFFAAVPRLPTNIIEPNYSDIPARLVLSQAIWSLLRGYLVQYPSRMEETYKTGIEIFSSLAVPSIVDIMIFESLTPRTILPSLLSTSTGYSSSVSSSSSSIYGILSTKSNNVLSALVAAVKGPFVTNFVDNSSRSASGLSHSTFPTVITGTVPDSSRTLGDALYSIPQAFSPLPSLENLSSLKLTWSVLTPDHNVPLSFISLMKNQVYSFIQSLGDIFSDIILRESQKDTGTKDTSLSTNTIFYSQVWNRGTNVSTSYFDLEGKAINITLPYSTFPYLYLLLHRSYVRYGIDSKYDTSSLRYALLSILRTSLYIPYVCFTLRCSVRWLTLQNSIESWNNQRNDMRMNMQSNNPGYTEEDIEIFELDALETKSILTENTVNYIKTEYERLLYHYLLFSKAVSSGFPLPTGSGATSISTISSSSSSNVVPLSPYFVQGIPSEIFSVVHSLEILLRYSMSQMILPGKNKKNNITSTNSFLSAYASTHEDILYQCTQHYIGYQEKYFPLYIAAEKFQIHSSLVYKTKSSLIPVDPDTDVYSFTQHTLGLIFALYFRQSVLQNSSGTSGLVKKPSVVTGTNNNSNTLLHSSSIPPSSIPTLLVSSTVFDNYFYRYSPPDTTFTDENNVWSIPSSLLNSSSNTFPTTTVVPPVETNLLVTKHPFLALLLQYLRTFTWPSSLVSFLYYLSGDPLHSPYLHNESSSGGMIINTDRSAVHHLHRLPSYFIPSFEILQSLSKNTSWYETYITLANSSIALRTMNQHDRWEKALNSWRYAYNGKYQRTILHSVVHVHRFPLHYFHHQSNISISNTFTGTTNKLENVLLMCLNWLYYRHKPLKTQGLSTSAASNTVSHNENNPYNLFGYVWSYMHNKEHNRTENRMITEDDKSIDSSSIIISDNMDDTGDTVQNSIMIMLQKALEQFYHNSSSTGSSGQGFTVSVDKWNENTINSGNHNKSNDHVSRVMDNTGNTDSNTQPIRRSYDNLLRTPW